MEDALLTVKHRNVNKSKKVPQYIATVTACLGSLAAGAAFSWTANISEDMKKFSYNQIPIDDNILGWIGSLAILGETFSCIPIGYFCNLVGRKKAMLYLTLPFMAGWLLILFAHYLWMIYLGRFLTGFAFGAFGVVAPLYISECAEKDIRGELSSYLDLMATVGILVANGLAMILEIRTYTIILSILPLVFAVLFAFQPESFVHYTKKNKIVKAKQALIRLRGESCDIEEELQGVRLTVIESMQRKATFFKSINKKAAKKAAFISFTMMIFQQTSGIEAVLLYTSAIFESTGVDIDANVSTLIFAAIQVVATFLSALVVDRLGRRFLLITSNVGVALALGMLALFLTFKSYKIVDDKIIYNLKSVPLVSLCVYVIAYSLGMGPIPRFLSTELFPSDINSIGCATAAGIGGFSAFLISKFYFDMESAMGKDTTFYFYLGSTLFCLAFVYFFVPETKNKTLAEIQGELNK